MTHTTISVSHALAGAAERYGVPGAQLSTRIGDRVDAAAHGVLQVGGGQAVTRQTPFLTGSITKMLAALVVLDAAERGELDLDQPVSAQGVPGWGETPRVLIGHASGRADLMPEPGDTAESFAARVAALPLVHPPGRFSYCNPAWSVVELLLQARTGSDFESLAADRILRPLGIVPQFGAPASCTSSHEVAGPGAQPQVVPEWDLPAASAAGARWWATADDLLRFADVYLEGGAGVVSPAVAAEQARPHVRIPGANVGDAWCLGCVTTRRGEVDVIGWDGYLRGQRARLRIYPALRAAFALLTNAAGPFTGGAGGSALADDLLAEFERQIGLPPRQPTGDAAATPRSVESLAGSYGPVQIEPRGNDGLNLSAPPFGMARPVPLARLGGNTFAFEPQRPGSQTVTFDEEFVYCGPMVLPRS